MKRIGLCISLLTIVALNSSFCAAETVAAAIPDWALGVLTIKELGKSLDKTKLYADKIVLNAGELAKQEVMSLLFAIPVDSGFTKDGPALIYLLDPKSTNTNNEKAMILPLADAAAVKQNLTNVFGVPEEKDGVLMFTELQPLPNPDKFLFVKFADERLFFAPSAAVLTKLSEFAAGKKAAELTGSPAGDAVLTLKVAAFKKSYGTTLQTSLMQGAETAAKDPADAAKIKQSMDDFLEKLWQADAIELAVEFTEADVKNIASAALEIRARATDGTQLGKLWGGAGRSVSGKLLRFLPAEAGVQLGANVYGKEVADFLRAELDKQKLGDKPESKPVAAALTALLDLLQLGDGESAAAINGKDSGVFGILALQVSDPARALASSAAAIDKVIDALNTQSRASSPHPDVLKVSGEKQEFSGIEIQQYNISVDALPPEVQKEIDKSIGYPLALQVANVDGNLLIVWGKDSFEKLKDAIGRQMKQDALASDIQSQMKTLPKGTLFLALLRPMSIARSILSQLPNDENATAERLTEGLNDAPLSISVRIVDGTAGLRIGVPATVPNAIIDLIRRMQRAGVHL